MIGRTMALALSLALAAGEGRAETVEVDGGQIYYETCGKGPQAIVLIHDGVINSASFDDMWPVLCKDFRVVRYDRRGYGKSPAANTPYSPQEDLAAVMRAANVEHASLAGFSFFAGYGARYLYSNLARNGRATAGSPGGLQRSWESAQRSSDGTTSV